MYIHLTDKDYPELPDLRLSATGEVTLVFEVVGLNKMDDETFEGEIRSCDLECKVKSMSVRKVSLEEAGEKAEENYVKTQTTPAP